MDSVKKLWLSLALPIVIFVTSLCIASWIDIQCSRIFFPLFLVFIIFILKLWFSEENLGKIYNDNKKLGLMTITLIILRMQWGSIINAPIGVSLDYFTSLGWLHGTTPSWGVILDIGLVLAILYYFTYKKGDLLEKTTIYTSLGSVLVSFIIMTLQKVLPTSTATIWGRLSNIDLGFNAFLKVRGNLGMALVIGGIILIAGIFLSSKWKEFGGTLVGIGMLILVICFSIFIYGKVKNFSMKGLFPPSQPPVKLATYSQKNDIMTLTFYPGQKSMVARIPQKFQILEVDTSGLKIKRYTPPNQRTRSDLSESDVIFARTNNYNISKYWLSLWEIQQKGFCKALISLYISLNSPKENVGGEIKIKIKLI